MIYGPKRIKMKRVTENIAGAGVCSMRIEFNLRHNVQLYRVDANRSMRLR